MSATSIDPERGDAARDPFDAELQALKRENRQHRQALDHVLAEIHSRMAESPRQRLAADLLMTLASEDLGSTPEQCWRHLPEMAEACLEAAGKIYPEPGASSEASLLRGVDWGSRDSYAGPAPSASIPPPPAAVEGPQAVSPFEIVEIDGVEIFRVRPTPGTRGDDEPRDSGAHPGVMLDRESYETEHARSLAFQDAQDAGKEVE